MIPQSMLALMDFHHELKDPSDPTSWKDPGGVLIYRLVDTEQSGRMVRVPITVEEGIKILLELERELWRARDAGTWNEEEDYETFIRWSEIILSGIGACPMCSGCEPDGINDEIERRRVADPEISEHFRKRGHDLGELRKRASE